MREKVDVKVQYFKTSLNCDVHYSCVKVIPYLTSILFLISWDWEQRDVLHLLAAVSPFVALQFWPEQQ